MSGFTKTTHKLISEISKGRTISPIPPTLDATLNTQGGVSGSGSTCFGLYRNQDIAKKAPSYISRKSNKWWIKFSKIN